MVLSPRGQNAPALDWIPPGSRFGCLHENDVDRRRQLLAVRVAMLEKLRVAVPLRVPLREKLEPRLHAQLGALDDLGIDDLALAFRHDIAARIVGDLKTFLGDLIEAPNP